MFKLKDLANKHTPVLPCTPNVYWDEMLQNNMMVKGYEDKDFNVVETAEVMYNIIQHALMIQEFRDWRGSTENNSGYRPELYNDVVLIEKGYSSTKDSDHKFINSGAWDCTNVPATIENQNKWIEICEKWKVNHSIGWYSWGMHLGWRRFKPNRIWDWR
jgi:hypothetical protein